MATYEVYVPAEMHPLDEWARSFLTLTGVREVCVTLPAVGGKVEVRFTLGAFMAPVGSLGVTWPASAPIDAFAS